MLVTAINCSVCVLLVCGCESLRLRDWPRNPKPIEIRISIELDRARSGSSGRRRAVGATGGVTASRMAMAVGVQSPTAAG